MRSRMIILFLLLSWGRVFAQEKNIQVPYTLADRERMVRLEVKLDELSKSVDYRFSAVNNRFDVIDDRFDIIDNRFEAIDKRFDAIDKRFDKIENALYGLIYSIFGLIGVFVAVLVWDRRKTLYPVQQDVLNVKDIQKEDHKKVRKIEETLNKLAEKDSTIREAMKHAGLL